MSNERKWGGGERKRGKIEGERGGQFSDIKFTKSFFRTVVWKLP